MTIPASSIITSFVDLMLSGVLLALLMMWYHFVPDLKVVTLPVFLLMAFAAALGIGLWISALMVRYRDFRFIVPFLVQFGLYLSPVGFTSDIVPASGARCMRSIRWLVSSTGFGGHSSAVQPRGIGQASLCRLAWSCCYSCPASSTSVIQNGHSPTLSTTR
jgi:hypothetical protein